ncbi:hypothetical protein PC118_g2617 [Phytophthora cactorum]|nr:hypothetical protein PC112_g7388 [Phytophthora cactorum]KAG2865779.1 hypothetical protein PC113_g3401 [Phytophthora cactorum]KAG2996112.1 hypothetical protein PC118_g2617 [Phytophthora cactorum]KAG3038480.1 hypothetical protein PC119_g2856 [Phytophthora cactorum]KAG3065633.1 hypothetical protein PC121_g11282 [Phytophthora cactorum]
MDSLLRMAASAGPPQREQKKDFEKGKWPFGGEGTPDTVPTPSGDGCLRVSEVLGRADKQAGEYSFGGKADTLPAIPGIYINDVGPISIPLRKHDTAKLIEKCEKSPFGHNFDTKMDDNVRKSWQLEPSQVEFKNPLWKTGLYDLTRKITERLGYTDARLECVLYKLLVYEEGGHFAKHQDTEKEDGMIATLVVQLPSLHEGGDLVIYSNGEAKHRHDFGKADDTAAFLPHYAVHYADAEHALEKVTKGFRLALVYSICLPKEQHHLKRVSDKPLSDDLLSAISMVSDGNESFALLLSHEYTEKSIVDFGCEALKGVDRVRFGALEEANALVAADKKLNFYIAELTHFVLFAEHYDEAGWFECERKQSITWYHYLPNVDDIGKVKKTAAVLNFLNPAGETLTQLWMRHGVKKFHGYTGNEGPSSSTKYSRYAIVAWPESRHAENALAYYPIDLAYEILEARKPFEASTVRSFLDQVKKRFETELVFSSPVGFCIKFCRLFCELVLNAGDPALVNFFFTELCPGLGGIGENETLIPSLVAIIRKYDWCEVGPALLSSLSKPNRYTWNPIGKDGLSEVELTLQVIDALDGGDAQKALLEMVLEEAMELKDELLCSPKLVPLFCKWSRRSSDDNNFKNFSEKLSHMDPGLLGPVIEGISQISADGDKTGELFELAKSIVPKRVEWLNGKIGELNKPFTWEMTDAKFCDSPEVQEFLRGPEASMDTKNDFTFDDFKEADDFAKTSLANQRGASFTMEAAGSDKDAYLKITKTRKWFDDRQKILEQYKAEVSNLMEHFGEKTDGGDKKRARHQ